jgi:hypothetical protein
LPELFPRGSHGDRGNKAMFILGIIYHAARHIDDDVPSSGKGGFDIDGDSVAETVRFPRERKLPAPSHLREGLFVDSGVTLTTGICGACDYSRGKIEVARWLKLRSRPSDERVLARS